MTETSIKRASLAELRRMKDEGKLSSGVSTDGESLGRDFWSKAEIVTPAKRRSVHLKLDAEVFDFFHAESGGKGHLTKMQNVLRAYVKAHR